MIELISGDPAAAEREVRPDCEMLERIGETFFLSTMAAMLARALRDQGRDDEALEVTRLAEKSAAPNDIDAQVLWRCIRAPILARAGALQEAEALVRAAVDMATPIEVPDLLALSWSALATVLLLRGQKHEARQALDEALRIYDAKGNRMAAQRLRAAASAA